MAGSYGEPEQVVRAYMSNPSLLRQVENMALEEQAVDWLLANTRISDKATTFKEAMDAA